MPHVLQSLSQVIINRIQRIKVHFIVDFHRRLIPIQYLLKLQIVFKSNMCSKISIGTRNRRSNQRMAGKYLLTKKVVRMTDI